MIEATQPKAVQEQPQPKDRTSAAVAISYRHSHGDGVHDDMLRRCVALYNGHYGRWDDTAPAGRAGQPIRMSMGMIRAQVRTEGGMIVTASIGAELIGYALAVRFMAAPMGIISWVTQLVVHADHRKIGVSKQMLKGVWAFSNDYAWGLVSANPFAIRALEKATGRRCDPSVIMSAREDVLPQVTARVSYMDVRKCDISPTRSVIDTDFPVEAANSKDMLDQASATAPWVLGSIAVGEEWLAMTLGSQDRLSWTEQELREFMSSSREAVSHAYDRMAHGASTFTHGWMKHTAHEVASIVDMIKCHGHGAGDPILDFGCGLGRHSIELARLGYRVTGVDFSGDSIERARHAASQAEVDVTFEQCDCRTYERRGGFAGAICLYDVIGSFPSDTENAAILERLVANVRPGGWVAISVMNRTLTEAKAIHTGDVLSDPKLLDALPPGNIMETTGNVFDPKYYLCDTRTGVTYRKEQFSAAEGQLPLETIVRDRRYGLVELKAMCESAGLETLTLRPVQSGQWQIIKGETDAKAKELLYVGRVR